MDTFKADIQKYLALNDRQTQLNREVAQIRNQKNNFEKNILDFGEKHRLMGKSLKIKQQKLVFEEQSVKKCLSNAFLKENISKFLQRYPQSRSWKEADFTEKLLEFLEKEKITGEKKQKLKIVASTSSK